MALVKYVCVFAGTSYRMVSFTKALLVLAVAVFAATVNAHISQLPDAMTVTLSNLTSDKLGLSNMLVAPALSCTMTTLVQAGDTYASIM